MSDKLDRNERRAIKVFCEASTQGKADSIWTGADVFEKILTYEQKFMIAGWFIGIIYSSPDLSDRKAHLIRTIVDLHPHRMRHSSLEQMSTAKVAQYFLDVADNVDEELLLNFLLHFITTRRYNLVKDFLKALSLYNCKDVDQFKLKLSKLTEKIAMKRIRENIDKVFPHEDVMMLIGMLLATSGQWRILEGYANRFAKVRLTCRVRNGVQYGPTAQTHEVISCYKRALSLQRRLFWLTADLREAAEMAEQEGVFPRTWVATEITHCKKEFESVRNTLLKYALKVSAQYNISDPDTKEAHDPLTIIKETSSIQDLRNLIVAFRRSINMDLILSEAKIGRKVIIDKLNQLRHREAVNFEPLSKLQSEAAQIWKKINRYQLGTPLDIMNDFAARADAYKALCTLIADDNIDLKRYDELKEVVTRDFDNDLALAALRGKLYLAKPGSEDKPLGEVAGQISGRHVADGNGNGKAGDKYEIGDAGAIKAEVTSDTANIEAAQKGAVLAQQDVLDANAPLTKEGTKKKYAYGFQSDKTSSDIASLIAGNGNGHDTTAIYRDLLWRLVFEGDHVNAYKLSLYIDTHMGDSSHIVPSWLIALVLLNDHMIGYGFSERALEEFEGRILNWEDQLVEGKAYVWSQAVQMMLAGLMISTSLKCSSAGISPSYVIAVMGQLRVKGAPNLNSILELTHDFLNKYVPLCRDYLGQYEQSVAWNAEHAIVVSQAREWFSLTQKSQVKYKPAAAVLQQWFSKSGFLHDFLEPVLNDSMERVKDVVDLIEYMSDEQTINQEMRSTDRAIRRASKQLKSVENIAGPAHEQLLGIAREAADLGRKWVKSVQKKPVSTSAFNVTVVGEFAGEFIAQGDQLAGEMEKIQKINESVITDAAVSVLKRAISDAMYLCSMKLDMARMVKTETKGPAFNELESFLAASGGAYARDYGDTLVAALMHE